MTSIEAMWTVRFDAPGGENYELDGGVVVIESGRIFGGDSGYAYLGRIEVSGQNIAAGVRCIRHRPNVTSIFGDVDELEIRVAGQRVADDRIEGQLHVRGFPPGVFVMQRLAELP